MAEAAAATFAAIASAATAATAATASALIGLGVGTATAKAIASFVIPTLINAGLSIAASALLAPSVNAEGSPTEWRPNPNAGIPVAIGRVATAGSIIHMDEHGPDNRYLTIANLLSVGPIDAIESFRADRVAVTFSGTSATSPAEYADKMFLSTSTGASATALSVGTLPHGTASLAGWGAQSTLPGLAHTLWTLYQDSKFKSYPQGAPEPLHILRGVKVYDPRKDSTYPGGSGAHRLDDASTWEFSKNPGLHAIAWALGHKVTDPNTSKVFRVGIGATASGVHWPAFVELANVCDANDWEVSALPTSADDPHQVLKAILQAGGARYASLAGKISCIARTPRTSTVTVSAADTAGAFEIEVNADRLVKRNTITPRCVQEDHDWQMTPQDAVTVAQYVTDDGGELAQSLDFPYVAIAPASANKDQPEQLAAYAMLDSRESIIGTVPFRPHMAQVEPGDVFTVDEPGFLLDGVELLCLQRTIDAANNVVQLTFMSESAGKHTFALGLTNTPPTPPGLTAPDIRDVPAPAADIFTVTPGAGQQPTIALTVTNADAAQRAYVIEYRPTTDGAGAAITYADDATGWEVFGQFDISTENVVVTGLEPNTGYQIAIRYVSEFGILGTRRILATVTTGALVADDAAAVGGIAADVIERAIEDGSELAAALLSLAFDAQEERLRRELLAVEAARNVFNDMLVGINAARDRADDLLEDAIAALADDLTALEVAINNADSGLQTQINARATINQLNAAIVAEQQSRATQINGLSASIQNLETGSGTFATVIYVNEAITTEQGARATAVSSLQAQIDAIDTGGSGPDLSGYATITQLNNVETSLTAAIATSETDITAAYTAALESKASITYVDTSFATATAAIATAEANLQAQINALDPSGEGPDFSSYALISYVDTVIATEQSARATAIQTLQAQLTTLSNSAATIAYVLDAVATETQARATALAQLEATLNASKASVQYVDNAVATETSARASALATLSASVTDGLNALAQDVTAVEAEVDSLIATRLIRVSAGDAAAGIQFAALQDQGGAASALNFFAQVFGYGTTVSNPRFFIDAQNGVMYALNAAGTHRTFEVEFSTGRVRHRAADGTVHYDSANGGTQTAGLAAGAVTNTDYREAGNTNLPGNGAWATVASFTYAAEGGSVGFETSITISHTTTTEVGVEAGLWVNGVKRGPSAYYKPATTFLSDMHFKRRVTSGLSGNCAVEIRCRASNTLGGVAGLAAAITVVDILETKR